MRDNQPIFIVISLLFFDLAFLNLTYWFFADIYEVTHLINHILASIIFNALWLVVERTLFIYDVRYLLKPEATFQTLFNACCVHLVLSVFGLYTIHFQLSRLFVFKFYTTFALITLLSRFIALYILRYIDRCGYVYKRIAIIGANKEGHFMKYHLESKNTFGIELVGFITGKDECSETLSDVHVIGNLQNIQGIIEEYTIDEIYWALSLDNDSKIREVIKLCDQHMIRFHTIPLFLAFPFKNLNVNYHSGIPIMHLREEPLELTTNRIIKRIFDIAFSLSICLFILSWLIPIVAIIIKCTSRGPVFYIQKRTGQNNRDFKMLKFRTMRINDEESKQATKNDSRVTKFGAFLRKTSLDEMPQFINCLIGDMSVVGPRPHMLQHTENYSKQINEFMVRHYIKSGITGWAQVNGARGETETIEKMKKRIDLDIWYLENWSLLLDIRICLKTIFVIFTNREQSY